MCVKHIIPKIFRFCVIHLKEIDPPTAAVEFGHLQGGQVQAVGQKDIFLAGLPVPVVPPAQRPRIAGLALAEAQTDNLVSQDRVGLEGRRFIFDVAWLLQKRRFDGLFGSLNQDLFSRLQEI